MGDKSRTVHTYYEWLAPNWGMEDLYSLFRESWERQGWKIKLYSHDDLIASPEYADCRKAYEAIPTVNMRDYAVMCMLRYLPMLADGGGLMVDLDVINYGFKPEMLRPGNYTLQQGSGPHGSQSFYGWICYQLGHWQETGVPPMIIGGQPHWSDMVFLGAKVPSIDVCVTYQLGDHLHAPLVHFSNGSLYTATEIDRHDRVNRIMAIRPIA